jgi:hypothetical protein
MKVSIAAALSVIIESQIKEQTNEVLRGQLSVLALEVYAHSLAYTETMGIESANGKGTMYRFSDGSFAVAQASTIVYLQPNGYATWDEAMQAYNMAVATGKTDGVVVSSRRPPVPTGEVPCTCPVCREGGSA